MPRPSPKAERWEATLVDGSVLVTEYSHHAGGFATVRVLQGVTHHVGEVRASAAEAHSQHDRTVRELTAELSRQENRR